MLEVSICFRKTGTKKIDTCFEQSKQKRVRESDYTPPKSNIDTPKNDAMNQKPEIHFPRPVIFGDFWYLISGVYFFDVWNSSRFRGTIVSTSSLLSSRGPEQTRGGQVPTWRSVGQFFFRGERITTDSVDFFQKSQGQPPFGCVIKPVVSNGINCHNLNWFKSKYFKNVSFCCLGFAQSKQWWVLNRNSHVKNEGQMSKICKQNVRLYNFLCRIISRQSDYRSF